ncbi:MAG: ribonuclease HII [Deltaproteobacteria bacterium]|nr:ribonuclease HII [Deltaproteobacteria bacterium]
MLTKTERRRAARMGVLLKVERELWAAGITHVAGCDEVGVGPLAGPVVAAAVILPPDTHIRGVDDSKTLSPQRRNELAEQIRNAATAIGVGIVEVEDIDRMNVYHAALEAMRRAVIGLPVLPDHIVVDARTIPEISIPQTPLVGGDGRCYSVAAASIVAKVARDAIMVELDARYPMYGFARHMGYGTAEHLAAIDKHGPCPVHRRSFAPVRQLRLAGFYA